jgi:hypothetical protein
MDSTPSGTPPPGAGSVRVAPGSTTGASPPVRRTTAWAAVIAVGVIVVVVLALALAGVLPFQASSAAAAVSYTSAESSAASEAAGYDGGGWSLILAAGFNDRAALSESSGASLESFCTISGISTPTVDNLTVPASSSSAGSGTSSAWLFLYRNGADQDLFVTDLDGTAALYATVGGGCALALGLLGVIGPNLVDSTNATSSANVAGGAAFLSAHPDANSSMLLYGGLSLDNVSLPPSWSVTYSTCPIQGEVGASGIRFYATVNAETGLVLSAGTQSVSCATGGVSLAPGAPGSDQPSPHGSGGAGTELDSVLSFESPGEAVAGPTSWYNFSIQSAGAALTLGQLLVQVEDPQGEPVVLAGGSNLSVLDLIGQTVAAYNVQNLLWLSGTATVVTSQEVFSLAVTNPGGISGDSLVVSAPGAYQGTVTVPIP